MSDVNGEDASVPSYWLGAYTPDSQGNARGVSVLRQQPDGTLRHATTVSLESPSFLARHPSADVVYAALEGIGAVQVLERRGVDGLVPIGDPIEVGEAVCHLHVTPDGGMLVASCYGDGRLVTIPLAPTGRPSGRPVEAAASIDPYADPFAGSALEASGFGESALTDFSLSQQVLEAMPVRQSRAHASLTLPDGRIVSTDLGHDAVRVWRRTAAGAALTLDDTIMLPFGVGPRHLAWHVSGHLFVVTEYSNEIFVLAPRDRGRLRVVRSTLATADSIEDGDNASELQIAGPDADRLYVAIRGTNRLSTLRIGGDGADLSPLADVETRGKHPRHFRVAGDLVHVANQHSDEVASFRLDARGIPSQFLGATEAASPTYLLPVPTAGT
jgi:6-phosphogluconolactonase